MLGEGGKVPDALPEKFGALIVPSCGFAQVRSSSLHRACAPLTPLFRLFRTVRLRSLERRGCARRDGAVALANPAFPRA